MTESETLEYLVHNLLPDDMPNENNQTQKRLQQDYQITQAVEHNSPGFTMDELHSVIGNIKNGTSPGIDCLKG